MAWRSSGATNEEMVNNLKRFGVISTQAVERGFRRVDRKFFVPKGNEDSAYSDQPLKEGSVHISAPHIYGSALEALELQTHSSLSFLNIGSGTGYLSCIVAEILGPKSLNFGIEIHEDVVKHSRTAVEKWRNSKQMDRDSFQHLEIVQGNGLHVSASTGESLIGFDRIYIGASVDKANLPEITKLLSPGGILVGPVDDELVKVIRIGPIPRPSSSNKRTSNGASNNDGNASDDSVQSSEGANESNEFTQQVLSGVRFAPLVMLPRLETVLPARLWNPTIQQYFPDSFQQATMQLLMCSNASLQQPPPRPKRPEERMNLAAMLPRVIWIEILSFTHRKWFDSKQTETEFLKKRLLEEQANAAKAQQARIEAEARCQVAERERDVYRLLARRWQSRLQLILQQQRQLVDSGASSGRATGGGTSAGDSHSSIQRFISGEERAAIFGLGAMLQQADSGDGIDEDEGEGGLFFSAQDSTMEEDNDDEVDEDEAESAMIVNDEQQLIEFLEQQEDSDDEEYEFQSFQSESEELTEVASAHRSGDVGEENESVVMDDDAYGETGNESIPIVLKPSGKLLVEQIRTVSMGSEDL